MSETMIIALVSAVATLLVSIITLVSKALLDRFKSKSEVQQKMYQSKRENLNGIYKTLIYIVNLYPNSAPNDILKRIEYASNYEMESFDSVIKSLDYQIEDYKNQLNIKNTNDQRRPDIEIQISNREYSKKNIQN